MQPPRVAYRSAACVRGGCIRRLKEVNSLFALSVNSLILRVCDRRRPDAGEDGEEEEEEVSAADERFFNNLAIMHMSNRQKEIM
eukprot:338981-Prorocentrum_minimum.AAC.1